MSWSTTLFVILCTVFVLSQNASALDEAVPKKEEQVIASAPEVPSPVPVKIETQSVATKPAPLPIVPVKIEAQSVATKPAPLPIVPVKIETQSVATKPAPLPNVPVKIETQSVATKPAPLPIVPVKSIETQSVATKPAPLPIVPVKSIESKPHVHIHKPEVGHDHDHHHKCDTEEKTEVTSRTLLTLRSVDAAENVWKSLDKEGQLYRVIPLQRAAPAADINVDQDAEAESRPHQMNNLQRLNPRVVVYRYQQALRNGGLRQTPNLIPKERRAARTFWPFTSWWYGYDYYDYYDPYYPAYPPMYPPGPYYK